MKSILLPLTDPETDEWATGRAIDAIVDLNAHLSTLLIDPVLLTVPVYPHYGAMTHYPLLLDQLRDEGLARQAKVKSILQDASEKRGVVLGVTDQAPSVQLSRTDGDAWSAVKDAAAVHDAVLFIRRVEASEPLDTPELLKDTLEYSGRPILVLTQDVPSKLSRRVGVAWNGSVESARAVSAALPILSNAEEVVIFSFPTSKTDANEGDRLRSYLSRHGIAAVVETRSPETSVGEALLAAAAQSGVTLLVTGGYTHSRLRQAVLGGVTRHLLARSTIPMLMAH
ncbi:nucleotide-binding universal stress UspA family protein [Melaminivora alkalimesophila]|uniref:Nucleotide-binding universal stress UspA family protein n=1 Tax=Melaminivora alkalimesophila TaxID=1165852 RepID=A0A317RB19_9BURK|nr:nucleotide-binding universal stress UspA family protein [Melaminivora alkalimesophila]